MDNAKFVLASRGIIGGLIPVVFGVLMLLGYEIEPQTQEEATSLIQSLLDLILGSADGLILLGGGVLAIWSRIRQERRPVTLALRRSP